MEIIVAYSDAYSLKIQLIGTGTKVKWVGSWILKLPNRVGSLKPKWLTMSQ